MESKKKPAKSYIIATPERKVLSTDNFGRALKKVAAMMKENVELFTFTDHKDNVVTTHQKEKHQKNYRVTITNGLPNGV